MPGSFHLVWLVPLLLLLAVGPVTSRADELPVLLLRQHHFVPDRVVVPAHQKLRLRVQNTDDTAEEFESGDLDRERLVPAGQSINLFLGPLEPGEYKFHGDFHQDTAQGVLISK